MKQIYNLVRKKTGITRQKCAMDLYYKRQSIRKSIFEHEDAIKTKEGV